MTQLHPGAKWVFRARGLAIAIALLFFFFFFGGAAFTILAFFSGSWVLPVGMVIFFLVIALIIMEVYARLAYRYFSYEVKSDCLLINQGIIWKRSVTIPYGRVQNVDITRGIFAQMFDFSSVAIQTAGVAFAYRGMPRSEGLLPALSIADAEKLRQFMLKKIAKK
ncbi:MAG: PH domain-containing protein [Nanoarchaeota archaeon]|nr:PH domain-containing protein [Nanoarchaeota archaeon]